MPLVELDLSRGDQTLPRDVQRFLREAERRIERFRIDHIIPGFVPSDFARAYCVLRDLAASRLPAGNLFCEWGSGFGVVACLAAMLDFDACGIEVEERLVDAARKLADDFDLPVEFVRGSFIPKSSGNCVEAGGAFAWLDTDTNTQETDFGADDFDVIFVYPWPDEEAITEALFERHAGAGAVLVTYRGGEDFRCHRKKPRRARGSR